MTVPTPSYPVGQRVAIVRKRDVLAIAEVERYEFDDNGNSFARGDEYLALKISERRDERLQESAPVLSFGRPAEYHSGVVGGWVPRAKSMRRVGACRIIPLVEIPDSALSEFRRLYLRAKDLRPTPLLDRHSEPLVDLKLIQRHGRNPSSGSKLFVLTHVGHVVGGELERSDRGGGGA